MLRKHLHGQLLIVVAGLLALFCTACGSGQVQPDSYVESLSANLAESQATDDGAFSIGGIADLDRNASYTDEDRLILGADFAASLPNQGLVQSGSSVRFNPQYAPELDSSLITPAFGIFSFALADYDQEIQLAFGVSDDPATEDDLYYAIANYVSGTWQWWQSDGSRMLTLADYEDYISPEGNIYFCVLMTGIDQAQLDYVRIGSGFAPSGTVSADVTLGDFPLEVNLTADFTDVDGTLVEYRWDFRNNGEIDEVTTEPVLNHIYSVPGTYVTRVHAVDNDGLSGTDFTTINVTGILPPSPPEDVIASDGTYGGQIHINWTAPSTGPPPKGFQIERADSENGDYSIIGSVSFAFKEFGDTTVTDESVYWYRVISLHDTLGNSDPSESDDGFMGILNPPTSVLCGQGTQPASISIGWTHPSTGATPEGYAIYRSTSVDGLKQFVASVGFENFFIDSTVPDGQTYFYFIESTKTNFPNSEFSLPGTGFTSQLVAPTNIMATDDASPTVVTVTWTHSSGSQVPAGYNIHRSTAVDGTYTQVGFAGYVETWDDVAATDGTVYFYKLTAIKPGWTESALSEDSDSGYVGLSKPLNLLASDNDLASEVTVSWLPPTLGPEPDEYEVFRSDTFDGTYTSIGVSSTFSYEDSSVILGTVYYYKAVAKKSGYANSADSNIDDGYAGVT